MSECAIYDLSPTVIPPGRMGTHFASVARHGVAFRRGVGDEIVCVVDCANVEIGDYASLRNLKGE